MEKLKIQCYEVAPLCVSIYIYIYIYKKNFPNFLSKRFNLQ